MQILTPQQLDWLKTIGWDILRSGIVGFCAIAVHRLHKIVANIRPGIVKDVSEAVMPEVRSIIDTHNEEDKRAFLEQKALIEAQGDKTREQISRAIQDHVNALHARPGNAAD